MSEEKGLLRMMMMKLTVIPSLVAHERFFERPHHTKSKENTLALAQESVAQRAEHRVASNRTLSSFQQTNRSRL